MIYVVILVLRSWWTTAFICVLVVYECHKLLNEDLPLRQSKLHGGSFRVHAMNLYKIWRCCSIRPIVTLVYEYIGLHIYVYINIIYKYHINVYIYIPSKSCLIRYFPAAYTCTFCCRYGLQAAATASLAACYDSEKCHSHIPCYWCDIRTTRSCALWCLQQGMARKFRSERLRVQKMVVELQFRTSLVIARKVDRIISKNSPKGLHNVHAIWERSDRYCVNR